MVYHQPVMLNKRSYYNSPTASPVRAAAGCQWLERVAFVRIGTPESSTPQRGDSEVISMEHHHVLAG